jgi:hypothetical protein
MRTTEPDHDVDHSAEYREAEAQILPLVAAAWTKGWQPAELVRYFRRTDDAVAASLTRASIAADHAAREPTTIDPRWAAQLEALDVAMPRDQASWLAEWVGHERVSWRAGARATEMLCLGLRLLRPLPVLIPPPGASTAASLLAGLAARADDPMLTRVRALLAQAESTTFEAEAETFTAKAQALITRHAIDVAMLTADPRNADHPQTIRIAIDDPYAAGKRTLLCRVAQHSRCRAVLHNGIGMVSITGLGDDIDATEMLFTSLLVQVQTAMHTAASGSPAGSHERSRGYRASFVLAYAERIGERLEAINAAIVADVEATSGREIVPLLNARRAEIDAAVTEMFGPLKSTRSRRTFDGAGWANGRLAADRARLNSGDLAPARKRLG